MARLRRPGVLLLVFALGVAAVALLPGTARSGAPSVVGPGPPVRPGTTSSTTNTNGGTDAGTTNAGTTNTTTTATVAAPATGVLTLGLSTNVQCGTGNNAGAVAFTSATVAALDVGTSITLTLAPTTGAGAVVKWTMTRTLVVGWPVPNTSDFGRLTINGCTARYTAPASTGGNTPRMFVTISAVKVYATSTTPSGGGEQGPTGVPTPTTVQLTIRGSGGSGPTKPCGYGYISVLASVSGGTTAIVVDGRTVGYNIVNYKVSLGTHSVTLYLPSGRTRSYTANVTDCQTWKITVSG